MRGGCRETARDWQAWWVEVEVEVREMLCLRAGEVSQIQAGRKDGCRSENGQCKTGGNCRAKTGS